MNTASSLREPFETLTHLTNGELNWEKYLLHASSLNLRMEQIPNITMIAPQPILLNAISDIKNYPANHKTSTCRSNTAKFLFYLSAREYVLLPVISTGHILSDGKVSHARGRGKY